MRPRATDEQISRIYSCTKLVAAWTDLLQLLPKRRKSSGSLYWRDFIRRYTELRLVRRSTSEN